MPEGPGAGGLRPAGTARRSGHRGTSLVTLMQMVAGRLGQTLVPKLALDAGIIAGSGLIARPLAGGASRTVALVWRTGSPRAAEFRLLGETMRGSDGQRPPPRLWCSPLAA